MPTIAISNILKPVDEIRVYKRLATSLAKTNKYAINIIGNAPKNSFQPATGITFWTVDNTINRGFFRRIRTLVYHFKKWRDIKPDLLILTSPDLVFMAVIFRWLFSTRIIYDVQENYFLNIIFQRVYLPPFNYPIAWFIRLIELVTQPFITHYFLAEKCYEHELPFTLGKSTVLENKATGEPAVLSRHDRFTLLFTGVISEYSGIHEAVQIFEILKDQHAEIDLKVVGYAFDKKLINHLRQLASKHTEIELTGITEFVNHDIIVHSIAKADLGLVVHQRNKISRNRIPSKLYEYTYHQLPYLVPEATTWASLGQSMGGAIPYNLNKLDIDHILELTKKRSVLFHNHSKPIASWSGESNKLIQVINTVLK
jgi:glycosyltransferase involved in cell wall biosynthesis